MRDQPGPIRLPEAGELADERLPAGPWQPYLSGGAYQNFTDRSQDDWPRAYYGQNLERLIEAKRRWDRDNLFRFPQSIPVSL